MHRLIILIAALALLGFAGCGDDDDDGGDGASTGADSAQDAAPAPEPQADLSDTSVKPEIAKPEGDPPVDLEVEDIVEGKGPAAKVGDTLKVQYVGVTFSAGEEFDASWDRGEPFNFELGAGLVIPGWDEGLVGMKKGGRRKLTIPADLAYGAEGSPPVIGPNETLVFVVDLVEIN